MGILPLRSHSAQMICQKPVESRSSQRASKNLLSLKAVTTEGSCGIKSDIFSVHHDYSAHTTPNTLLKYFPLTHQNVLTSVPGEARREEAKSTPL